MAHKKPEVSIRNVINQKPGRRVFRYVLMLERVTGSTTGNWKKINQIMADCTTKIFAVHPRIGARRNDALVGKNTVERLR